MTTLTQPLAAEAARHSRHFQLIVDIHLLLVSEGDLLLGRRAGTGYGDGAYEPPSGRLAERETLANLLREERKFAPPARIERCGPVTIWWRIERFFKACRRSSFYDSVSVRCDA